LGIFADTSVINAIIAGTSGYLTADDAETMKPITNNGFVAVGFLARLLKIFAFQYQHCVKNSMLCQIFLISNSLTKTRSICLLMLRSLAVNTAICAFMTAVVKGGVKSGHRAAQKSTSMAMHN
jgi:hypothetical protein